MKNSSQTEPAEIDVYEVLRQRREVAIIWCIADVRETRPDLNEDQSWQVLQACYRQHDCTVGFTWEHIECVADSLFPEPTESQCEGKEDL